MDDRNWRPAWLEAGRDAIEQALLDVPAATSDLTERWGVIGASGRWQMAGRQFALRVWLDESATTSSLRLEAACWIDDEDLLERRVLFKDGHQFDVAGRDETYRKVRVAAANLVEAIRDASDGLGNVEPVRLQPPPSHDVSGEAR
jgi:hypothetical protein